MFAYFAKFILWLFGWKVDQNIPKEKSYIIVVAPHTSNWDFIVGRLVIGSLRVPQRVLMKKEMFFFPIKYLLYALGAMPIDRKASEKMVDYIVNLFKVRENSRELPSAVNCPLRALSLLCASIFAFSITLFTSIGFSEMISMNFS